MRPLSACSRCVPGCAPVDQYNQSVKPPGSAGVLPPVGNWSTAIRPGAAIPERFAALLSARQRLPESMAERTRAVAKQTAAGIRRTVPDAWRGERRGTNRLTSIPIPGNAARAQIQPELHASPANGTGAGNCRMSAGLSPRPLFRRSGPGISRSHSFLPHKIGRSPWLRSQKRDRSVSGKSGPAFGCQNTNPAFCSGSCSLRASKAASRIFTTSPGRNGSTQTVRLFHRSTPLRIMYHAVPNR